MGLRFATHLLLALLFVAAPAAAWQGEVQSEAPPPDAAELSDEALDDLWGFEDEEDVEPTLAEQFRNQWVDLALFGGFAVLALVGFFRKSEPLKYAALVAAVLYLGVWKSQLISIVNVFALLSWNLPIVSYNLGWYFFAIFTVATTILWGRVYCGRVCAFGALTQLMDKVVPSRLQVKVPRTLERRAGYIKYALLAIAVGYYLATQDIAIRRYVEPFWMFTFYETTPMWIGLGVLLLASVFVRNLYCRFLCPVGAFLGMIASATTVFRIKRWSECSTCRICEKTCEWGAIRGPQIVKSECVRCDDCERLYHNEQRCPHHLIIIRKADIMARRSVAPTPSAAPAVPTMS